MAIHARVVGEGLFVCCEPDLTDADGSPVNIEVSAVVCNQERLVFGSDKNVPGEDRSPVFSLAVDDGHSQANTPEYDTADLIKNADKYEDFALTDDGTHMVAITGFDRVTDDDAHKDCYNRLLV
jgi:hypothetical protein